MTNGEAINWIINLSADIGKAEHSDLWHYEQALSEIREMLESAEPVRMKGKWIEEKEDWRNQIMWVSCSECGFASGTSYNFCPNCGADMRGEHD